MYGSEYKISANANLVFSPPDKIPIFLVGKSLLSLNLPRYDLES